MQVTDGTTHFALNIGYVVQLASTKSNRLGH